MNKIILIIAGLVCGFIFLTFGKPTILASEELSLQNQDAYAETSGTVGGRCFDGDKCLTIYVAPWCPVCTRLKPTIISLTQELKADGFDVKVIVGNDSQKATEAYAKDFPFPVYLDAESRFYKKVKQRGVPFFLVSNKKGQVINKMAGGIPNVRAMRDKLEI